MTEQEQQKHNEQIDILSDIMKEQNIKCVYRNDKTTMQFIYFDDVED